MEVTARSQLYRTMNASTQQTQFSKETAQRILTVARPHRRKLVGFLVLSVVLAALAVGAPPPGLRLAAVGWVSHAT